MSTQNWHINVHSSIILITKGWKNPDVYQLMNRSDVEENFQLTCLHSWGSSSNCQGDSGDSGAVMKNDIRMLSFQLNNILRHCVPCDLGGSNIYNSEQQASHQSTPTKNSAVCYGDDIHSQLPATLLPSKKAWFFP